MKRFIAVFGIAVAAFVGCKERASTENPRGEGSQAGAGGAGPGYDGTQSGAGAAPTNDTKTHTQP